MKRALLVIDVQNEYFFGKLPVSHPPGSLDSILKVMDVAAVNHIPIVMIQHAAKSGTSPVFRKGSPEWDLFSDWSFSSRRTLFKRLRST
jgi:nicotinamidase-related amidase